MSEQKTTVFVMDSECCDCGELLGFFGECPRCSPDWNEDEAYAELVGEYEYENYLILMGVYDE